MRKIFLAAALSLTTYGLFAQDLETIKTTWLIGQVKKAKEDIDKAITNTKISNKAEAWILKAAIYAALSTDKEMASQSGQLLQEAISAFNTYKQKEPDFKLLKAENSMYTGAPGTIYSSFFNDGAAAFNKKEWEKALTRFKSAIEMSDFLIQLKLIDVPIDTNGVLLAGASAQNAEHPDEAAKYYTRLADIKLGGADNEFIYPFLVEHFIKTRDKENKEKYLAIGKQLYPKNSYWCNIPLIEAGEDTLKIFEAYEQMIKENCADHATYYDYARELYNYTYFSKAKHADHEKYEARISEMIKKSLEGKQTPEANILMCRVVFIPINDLIDKYNAAKGTKPDELKKKGDLLAQLNKKYDEMLPYAQAAYDHYDSKSGLKAGEKGNFKMVTNMIVEYWTNKKDKVKQKQFEDKLKEIE